MDNLATTSRETLSGGRFCCLMALAVGVYLHPMNAPENPDYARRAVKPPSLELFGGKPHFMSMRVLPQTGWRQQLDATVERDRLGDVIWAAATLFAMPSAKARSPLTNTSSVAGSKPHTLAT